LWVRAVAPAKVVAAGGAEAEASATQWPRWYQHAKGTTEYNTTGGDHGVVWVIYPGHSGTPSLLREREVN